MYIRKRRLGIKGTLYLLLCLVIIAAAGAGIFMYMMGMFTPQEPEVPEECDHEWKLLREKEATCLDEGSRFLRCELCQEEKTTPISPLGHKLSVTVEIAATCTEPGATASERCGRIGCGYSKPAVTIPPLGHVPTVTYETATEVTCYSNSYVGGSHCATCKATLEEPTMVSPAIEHEYVDADPVAPTCASDGSAGGTWCKYCHKFDQQPDEIIPMITDRHTGNIVVDTDADGNVIVANCTTEVWATCDCCQARILIEGKDPDNHAWVTLSEQVLPDCKTKTDGVTAVYECAECKAKIGGTVIAHELCHDFGSMYCTLKQNDEYVRDSNGVPMAPTETSAGRVIISCTGGCSEYPIEVDVPPLGSGDFNEDNDIFDDGIVGKKDEE